MGQSSRCFVYLAANIKMFPAQGHNSDQPGTPQGQEEGEVLREA
jgi:hypothetical protein